MDTAEAVGTELMAPTLALNVSTPVVVPAVATGTTLKRMNFAWSAAVST